MAKCKNCGRGGLFRSVDRNGLCRTCQPIVLPEIDHQSRTLATSHKAVTNARKADTALSRLAAAIASCDGLIPFADKGIPTTEMDPRELRKIYSDAARSIVEESVRAAFSSARRKAEDGTTDTTKLNGYSKAVADLSGLLDYGFEVAFLEAAVFELRKERDNLKFDLTAQKAAAAIAKGQQKKALDLYIDAMLALANDSTPDDEQEARYEHARAKIIELGGTPPDMTVVN